MVRGEPGQVVVRAELGGEGVQEPDGTRAPGLAGDERALARGDPEGAGAVGGQRGAPDGARLVDAVGGIAATAAVRGEGEPDVDAERGLPLAPQSRGRVGCGGSRGRVGYGRLGGGHWVGVTGWSGLAGRGHMSEEKR